MNNKWISVKEDLPKEGGRYWCYLEHINSLSKSHFQWNCSYDAITKTFSDRSLNDGETVTYWQPLAKPPEEEPKDHIPDIGKMIKEDELKEKFKYAITWMGSDLDGKLERCTEIAQQYANSKLDELEKWCDEQFKHADALDKQEDTETRYWGGKKDGISLAKNKISSLKQQ